MMTRPESQPPPGEPSPSVAVLVLNYNGLKWLDRCFSSLMETSYPHLELCLVDNASSDGSVTFVKDRFPSVRIIRFERNHGFADGYNRAVRSVDTDYVVLLNNDTQVVNPGWITDIVNAIHSRRDVAAAACKMLLIEKPELLSSVGGRGYWWTRCLDIGFGVKDDLQYDTPPIEPFSFCGGGAVVRRSLFLDLGGFDRRFFAYGEDFDLSWRLRLKGYRIVYVPSAVILHHFSGSFGGQQTMKNYLSPRNFLRSMIKNYSLSSLVRGLPNFFVFTFLTRFLGYLFVLRKPNLAWAVVKGVGWNVVNLPDTIRERRSIQATRTVSDRDIRKAMGPSGHESLRRLLAEARRIH